jgi:hypothetical protein
MPEPSTAVFGGVSQLFRAVGSRIFTPQERARVGHRTAVTNWLAYLSGYRGDPRINAFAERYQLAPSLGQVIAAAQQYGIHNYATPLSTIAAGQVYVPPTSAPIDPTLACGTQTVTYRTVVGPLGRPNQVIPVVTRGPSCTPVPNAPPPIEPILTTGESLPTWLPRQPYQWSPPSRYVSTGSLASLRSYLR